MHVASHGMEADNWLPLYALALIKYPCTGIKSSICELFSRQSNSNTRCESGEEKEGGRDALDRLQGQANERALWSN